MDEQAAPVRGRLLIGAGVGLLALTGVLLLVLVFTTTSMTPASLLRAVELWFVPIGAAGAVLVAAGLWRRAAP